jgi:hypothetical protein
MPYKLNGGHRKLRLGRVRHQTDAVQVVEDSCYMLDVLFERFAED